MIPYVVLVWGIQGTPNTRLVSASALNSEVFCVWRAGQSENSSDEPVHQTTSGRLMSTLAACIDV